jgi:hypothetical protein
LAWLSVLWAGLAGVLIVASEVLIAYLVLMALEAVSNARTRIDWVQREYPGLRERIHDAGLMAIPALVCCLVLGLLISHELRRSAAPAAATRRGTLMLVLVSAATAATAAWLLATGIPLLHTNLAEGLWLTIAPADAAVLVVGFGGLALGLAARGADRPGPQGPDEEVSRPRWSFLSRRLTAAATLVLLYVIINCVQMIGGYARWWLKPQASWFYASQSWLWDQLWVSSMPWNGWLVLALTEAWVFWRLTWFWWKPLGTGPTPIDAWLGDRAALVRFAARWVALTVLMVAALPVLFVVGLAVLDGVLRAHG